MGEVCLCTPGCTMGDEPLSTREKFDHVFDGIRKDLDKDLFISKLDAIDRLRQVGVKESFLPEGGRLDKHINDYKRWYGIVRHHENPLRWARVGKYSPSYSPF
jgi:hypothetical protein